MLMEHTFDSIKIGLASPEKILSWSSGEVTKPETINYRTQKPEKDGLFCEKIFGPTKDWECACGKSKRSRNKGHICERCGVEVNTKKVRRERMGHITLACPVSHIWYFKAIPSRMGLVLDISPKALENVLYFVQRIVIDPGETPLMKYQLLNETEYNSYYEKYGNRFVAEMGAEAIKKLLQEIDIEALSKELKEELLKSSGQKKVRIIKRLEIVEAFRKSGNRPEWMILDVLPVIPPDIRPMVPLDGGRYAASDLNDLYRRVINRNNRLKKQIEIRSPELIIKNEKRMLQEAVDSLIDNGKRGKAVTGPGGRDLKSLSEMLRGKQGRFRQNLLGKRVDYSGRSVIVVGPNLKIYQCGLPREMALELFKPFVMKRLVETGKAANIKEAKKNVEQVVDDVWDALENVIKEHPVLLNRAPTLHRLSIQAFEPVLVEGRAIRLHPLVCKAFNADFDGDQMPVHVPLSSEAQAEARFLMLSANNLLKPVDGKAIAVPSQDMVLGSYYLTLDKAGEKGEGSVYRNFDEAMMAYETKQLELHAPIKIRVEKTINGEKKSKVIDATLGRLIFNEYIPQDLGYVDREVDPFGLEVDFVAESKKLSEIVDRTIKIHGFTKAAEVLDHIKEMGYKYSTRASLSISVADMIIPESKAEILKKADAEVDQIFEYYNEGELSEEERYNCVISIWDKATNAVTKEMLGSFNRYNPIKMMAESGARGSEKQMRQLAGMRGLMFSATGKTMEIPVKSNFREGISILEYFMAAKSSRKSLSDTALKTADSGYLTRRLVDVSHEVIVRSEDCGTRDYMVMSDIKDNDGQTVEKLQDRILGRYTVEDVVNPQTGEIIIKENEMILSGDVKKIIACGIKEVKVRSVLRCKAKGGVCAHCYGMDLASSKPVNIGEAVGVIAAQSIGEPGTQLTMRTFHTGGVAGANITQGLPRVEELFEARRPKSPAIASEATGEVHITLEGKLNKIHVTDEESGQEFTYDVPFKTTMVVHDGDKVVKGQALTEGSMAPLDILKINGIEAVYDYIVREVQKVYRSQNVDVDDKHIEVITRQMTRKVKVEEPGDTELIEGVTIDVTELIEENEKIQARIDAGEVSLRLATYSPILLGITKAASSTESFLSAASFQETTRALTEAAIRGKVDHLLGLKENVIIGKLIPAGTGLNEYNNIGVKKVEKKDEEVSSFLAE
ncbi:MAG: DNA-directed RNA polymerase subunit beta' [Ruminococcaceae bacterium]|nr:DNA-directed RNA polymerase subunit beta' [Oscillospiraceae bacterium]